ncbi:MAG: Ig-like domain-containing protein, partial [Pirellulales bacterium]
MGRRRSRAWGRNERNVKSRGRIARVLPTRRLRLEVLEDRRLLSLAGFVGVPPLGGLEWITAATDEPAEAGTPTEIAFSGEAGILTASPAAPDLLDISDTGVSNTDNLTNLDNSTPEKSLQFAVGNTIVGATVTLYADGTAIGSAVADGATTTVTTTVTTNGSLDLADGPRTITARQTVPGEGESPGSAALEVTIDTVAQTVFVNPVRLGGYDTSGYAYGVAIVGTRAYVADGYAGLVIIDVTNPAAPVRRGGYDTSGYSKDVAVSGTLAYVADSSAGLQIIDVSNPAAPKQVGGYDTSGSALGVAVSGTVAYVADENAGLVILDVTDPAASVRLGGYNTSGFAYGVAIVGTLAYVADYDAGLVIVDVSDPTVPRRLGALDINGLVYDVAVFGTRAYLAADGSGLQIIDVSDPTAPVQLAAADTSGRAFGVAVSGTLAYVADYTAGLQIIDVSDPGAPVRLGGYDTAGYAYGVAVSGTLAYVADHYAGLQIIEAGSLAAPPAPDLQPASDTGANSTDNITGDNTPTFSVWVPDGFYFRFYRDGVQISGDFESGTAYTTPVQADGLFGYAVAAVDPAGNVSPLSPVLSVTIDTSIPSAPDLLALSDTGVSATDNITNLDNSGPEKSLQFAVGNTFAGATVTLYADDNAIGSAVADSATTTVATNGSLDLADGAHTIKVLQVLPGQAASKESAILNLTVYTSVPATPSPPDLEVASDTGISNTDNLTSDNTPSFSVSAGVYYRFYRDGVQISGDYGSGTYTAPVQADGTYSYSVLAVDTAGNVSAPSAALSVTIDTSIPAAPDLLPVFDTGISTTDNLTNLDNSTAEKSLQFTVGNTIAGATVTLYAEGVAIGSATAEAGTTTVTTNGSFDLADGAHTITARQTLPGRPEASDSARLRVTIDTLANVVNARRLGGYDTVGPLYGVVLLGTLAYVADGPAGLVILDVTNSAAPVRLGGYDTAGYAEGVAVSGTLAFVAEGDSGLHIIDVSNPAAPVRLGGYDTSGYAENVAVSGTVAYVADGYRGLQIIDVSNPAAPVRLGGYDTSGRAYDVAVSGTLAYVADGAAGLQIIDVTNPAVPVRLGGYDTSGDAEGVAVSGTLAYVADDSA